VHHRYCSMHAIPGAYGICFQSMERVCPQEYCPVQPDTATIADRLPPAWHHGRRLPFVQVLGIANQCVFLQILGTISASAAGLVEYIQIAQTDDPSHWMALPAAEGANLKLDCHRNIALHLIGSHVIGDIGSSPFCDEVTRRLEERDHSAFDPDLDPTDIIHRRIVGYHALHKEAQARGLGKMPLLSSNHDQWNRTLVKALTPQGRADILHVILQDLITAARDIAIDE
jgi:hypothetical protein